MEEFTREDFERNMNIIAEQMKLGKLKFPMGYSGDGLLRVRKAPNGRIDFLTVDEGVRSLSNTMAFSMGSMLEEMAKKNKELQE